MKKKVESTFFEISPLADKKTGPARNLFSLISVKRYYFSFANDN